MMKTQNDNHHLKGSSKTYPGGLRPSEELNYCSNCDDMTIWLRKNTQFNSVVKCKRCGRKVETW